LIHPENLSWCQVVLYEPLERIQISSGKTLKVFMPGTYCIQDFFRYLTRGGRKACDVDDVAYSYRFLDGALMPVIHVCEIPHKNFHRSELRFVARWLQGHKNEGTTTI
jgi:hypothetical protein